MRQRSFFGPSQQELRTTAQKQMLAATTIGLRLAGLVGRLAIAVYIARFIGLDATAIYGLTVAGSAAMTTLTGLGLDQRMAHRAVGASPGRFAFHLRNRLLLRAGLSLPILACFAAYLLTSGDAGAAAYALPILFLEPIVYELQQAYLYRRRPVLTNLLLFIRAAGWVPQTIALGLIDPDLRDIRVVLLAWTAGLVTALAIPLVAVLRRRIGRELVAPRVGWARVAVEIRRARLILLSELGFLGLVYSNRVFVAALYGQTAAGAFVFVWSLSNAVVPLVQAGVFNHVSPRLVRIWRTADAVAWEDALIDARRETLRLSLQLTVVIAAVSLALLPYVGVPLEGWSAALLALMLAANVVRLQADLLQQALFSQRFDPRWAKLNCLFVIVSPCLALALVALFGVVGAGLEMLASALALFLLRERLVARTLAERYPA